MEFDYVIVGGGTAASILAYRLGERGFSVCVLEAGPKDRNPWIRIPVGWVKTLKDPRVTWQFEYEASAGTDGRKTPLVQGRVLGGSSAVNGAVYNRGQKEDFDGWEALGNPGWGYSQILKYFRKTERFADGGDDEYRGRDGLMPVTTSYWRDEVADRFIEGAKAVGMPENPDYNGESQSGVNYTQGHIVSGKRWSAAHAFLRPAVQKFGVKVITEALAERVILEGGRAKAVDYSRAGSGDCTRVSARKGVVVCAGAIGSPALLQRSGIGPAEVLNAAGVTVQRALEGVGRNLRDHYVPRVVVRARNGVTSINERVRGAALVKEAMQWLMGRPSVLGISPVLVYGFWKSRADLTRPDIALSYFPANYKLGMIGHLDDKPGMTCGGFQLRPESQGHVHITGADAGASPEIQPNFLAHSEDQRVVVGALKCARAIMQSDPMRAIVEAELLPGPDIRTDDEMLGYAREYGSTGYHAIGTCRMGGPDDPHAVVDPKLKVYGVDGLHVMDASVMPTLVSANTAAATMMIAEKGADLLLNESV